MGVGGEEAAVDAHQAAVVDGAAQQAAQNVAAGLVAGPHAVGHEHERAADVVADDAHRWGAAPFHYAGTLYSWVADELEVAQAPRALAPAL